MYISEEEGKNKILYARTKFYNETKRHVLFAINTDREGVVVKP
jgi:hypothetical protein